MKKTILIACLLAPALFATAQKNKLRDARDYLRDNDYKRGLPAINEVVENDDTKGNAEAWFLRGKAYYLKAADTSAHAAGSVMEANQSFAKALALKPDYETEIDPYLYNTSLLYFNAGVAAYSAKDYSKAYDNFMQVPAIYNMGTAKRFAANKDLAKSFPDIVASAKSNAAYSALNANRDNDALSLFNELKAAPVKDSNVYQAIIEINQRQKNDAQTLASITEARAQFPNSQQFRNLELNYYIKSGRQDVLLGKLEEAVKADPNNAELQFNLANAYQNAAFPKDAAGKDLPRPAAFNDIFAKGEEAYRKTLASNPNNPDYNYNFGVLYYDVAVDLNKQMMAITGNTAADIKKSEDLLKQRNDQFNKAMPYFEAAYKNLDTRTVKLTHDEKLTFQSVMIGMRSIYSSLGNTAKAAELKAKLDAFH